MRHLFRINVSAGSTTRDIYVIAKDPSAAEKVIKEMFIKWGYLTPTITHIERIAVEDQYGKPNMLLEAK